MKGRKRNKKKMEACFPLLAQLISYKTSPGMNQSPIVCPFPHQSSIRKCPIDMSTGQTERDNHSIDIPSSQLTLASVKLAKN